MKKKSFKKKLVLKKGIISDLNMIKGGYTPLPTHVNYCDTDFNCITESCFMGLC